MVKAMLILDPQRAPEQTAYIAARAQILYEAGDNLWVSMAEKVGARLVEHGILVQIQPEADLLQLPSVTFNPSEGVPVIPAAWEAPPATDAAYTLVQFVGPALPAWLYEIGVELFVQNVPVNAAVFRLAPADVERTRALPYIVWVGVYHPAYKISPGLAGRSAPFDAATLRSLSVDASRLPEAGEAGNTLVSLFADAESSEARAQVAGTGVAIVRETMNGFVVNATAEQIVALARIPAVFAVSEHLPDTVGNERGAVIIGTTQVQHASGDYLVNLDGSGEIVGVHDTGLDTGTFVAFPPPAVAPPPLVIHADVQGRVLMMDNVTALGTDAPDTNGHGTHVTGSIAGDGTGSGGRVRGMAPRCFIVMHGGGFDFTVAFPHAYRAGARVHNNSWGTVDMVTNNAYLPSPSGDIDRFCYLHPEMLILFAAHNHEKDVLNNATGAAAPNGDGTLDMVRLPRQAVAKNVLTIGASENWRSNDGWSDTYRAFSPGDWEHRSLDGLAGTRSGVYTMSDNPDQVALFSNRGIVRASGGRIKPDLVAPGTNILSMRSSLTPPASPRRWTDPKTVSDTLYTIMHGTSMATPIASGAAILTRQFYRARFGQMRRPILLQGVPLPRPTAPANTPRVRFVDRPALCSHAHGALFAWVTPALADGQKDIMAAALSRDMVRVGPPLVTLKTDVGDQPVPALANLANATLLLYRARSNQLRLCRYTHDLAAGTLFTVAPGFGTNGEVNIVTGGVNFPPSLLAVGEHAAVVWSTGSGEVRFQRFNGATGAAVDASPVNLGTATQTAPQPYLAHNSDHYAAVWVNRTAGGRSRVQIRMVGSDGNAIGGSATNLVDQPAEIRDASLVWDNARGRFVVAWCDARTAGKSEIRLLFLNADGTPDGGEVVSVSIDTPANTRRPLVAPHPGGGYVLAWEDDTRGSYDVYTAFLGDDGREDARLRPDPLCANRKVLLISDTPVATEGMSALVDARGIVALWQSEGEVNAHECGVYALRITPQGAFQAQADPNTPLINSGQYVAHTLFEQTSANLTSVDMVATGGNYYLLREIPGITPPARQLKMVKTNADGLPDTSYGVHASRTVATGAASPLRCALHWSATTNQVVLFSLSPALNLSLFDINGQPEMGFGSRGAVTLAEATPVNTDRVFPQVGIIASAPAQAVAVYGVRSGANVRVRAARVRLAAPFTVTQSDLMTIGGGTAAHGWFAFINGINRGVAVWHDSPPAPGAGSVIYGRMFDAAMTPLGAARIQITTLGGESTNAVIAVRPDYSAAVGPGAAREFGVAWQYRANNATPWEIRFSRLTSALAPLANPPAPAPQVGTTDVRAVFPTMTLDGGAIWPADASATEPQLISTLVHDPWDDYSAAPWNEPALPPAPPPPPVHPLWSPGYGLAFIRQRPGRNRVLCFVALDENGRRARLIQPPNVVAAPIVTLTDESANVRDFRLVWNGRAFRLTWTEEEGGVVRHKQAALTRLGSRAVYDQPSAPLLRATLINGATNPANTPLPNLNDGYGWGRINLRQSITPSSPVTFHVRDDNAVGQGQTARYRFTLPPGTKLLRATLAWNDVPVSAALDNQLRLHITAPGGNVYYGNTWEAARAISRAMPPGVPPAPSVNVQQIALIDPPSGDYLVEVVGVVIPANQINPLRVQPFALVFVGSGEELPLMLLPPADSYPFY